MNVVLKQFRIVTKNNNKITLFGYNTQTKHRLAKMSTKSIKKKRKGKRKLASRSTKKMDFYEAQRRKSERLRTKQRNSFQRAKKRCSN